VKPFCTARCLRYSTEPPSTSIYNFNEINPEDKQVHQTRTPGSENWTNIQRKDHISSFSTFNLIEIMDRSTRYPLTSLLYLDNIYRRAAISIAIPFLISWKLTNYPRHSLWTNKWYNKWANKNVRLLITSNRTPKTQIIYDKSPLLSIANFYVLYFTAIKSAHISRHTINHSVYETWSCSLTIKRTTLCYTYVLIHFLCSFHIYHQ
jgi:hypothetical protein